MVYLSNLTNSCVVKWVGFEVKLTPLLTRAIAYDSSGDFFAVTGDFLQHGVAADMRPDAAGFVTLFSGADQ